MRSDYDHDSADDLAGEDLDEDERELHECWECGCPLDEDADGAFCSVACQTGYYADPGDYD